MKNPPLATPDGHIVFIRTPRRLNATQVAMALQGMPDDDPRLLAFFQLLDEGAAGCMLATTNERSSNDQIRHAAGGNAALLELRAKVMNIRKAPVPAPKATPMRRRPPGR